jgi:hypothetical protein
MLRLSARCCSLLLVLALAALPLAGEVYHVKLRNGSVIDTAYQPVQASWDPSLALVLTDVGNWIGLEQSDIEGVESETQVRGFGVAINTSTIAIGWAPNDAIDPATQQQNAPTATDLAIQKLAQEQQQRATYTVQQGVSSEQTQGIPSGLAGYGGYGGGAPAGLPGYRPPNTPSTPVMAPVPSIQTPPVAAPASATPPTSTAPPGPG